MKVFDWFKPARTKMDTDLEQQRQSQKLATEARTSETSTPVCPMCGMWNDAQPFPVRGSGMCLRHDCPD